MSEGAAWHQKGAKLTFPPPDFIRFASHGSYAIDPHGQRGSSVDTLLLDDLPVKQRLAAIKVDVQGADLFALQGARRLIERHRPTIIFEFEQQFQNEFATTFQEYVDFVAEIGYRFREVVLGINYLIVPR